jgi:hypothetical protein
MNFTNNLTSPIISVVRPQPRHGRQERDIELYARFRFAQLYRNVRG